MFRIISRNDAIKRLTEYFNTEQYSNVGILFEKNKDGIKLLDEVKEHISKKDSVVWNKIFLENKDNTRFIVENCRNPEKIFEGWTIFKFFVEYNAFVKHLDDICDNVLCHQSCINPERVENFIICDSEEEVNYLKEKELKIICFD